MYENRLEICKSCDKLNIYMDKIYQCKECACILNIKARIGSMECPLKKWGKENNSTQDNCSGC